MKPDQALNILASLLGQAQFMGTFEKINSMALKAQTAIQVLNSVISPTNVDKTPNPPADSSSDEDQKPEASV